MVGPGGDAEQTDDALDETSDPDRYTREAHRDLLLKMAATAERFAVTEDELARVLLWLAKRGGAYADRQRGLAAEASEGARAARERALRLRQDADSLDWPPT